MKLARLGTLVLAAVVAFAAPATYSTAQEDNTIIFLAGPSSDPFWGAVQQGFDTATKELGIKTQWTAPADFNEVARMVESYTGAKRMRLFGLGFVVNAYTFFARPAGATDVKIAIFSNRDQGNFFNGSDLRNAVNLALDPSWHEMVRIRSFDDRKQSLIYVRHDQKKIHLLIAVGESNQSVLVQLKLTPQGFIKWLNDQDGFRDGIDMDRD